MAKSSQEISRLNAKSTNREEDMITTAAVLDLPLKEFNDVPQLGESSKAQVISIVNHKGGVGKTTSTINLGAALAELGRRVLLIDFDSQSSMTSGLGVRNNPNPQGSIWQILMDPTVGILDHVLKTDVPRLDYIAGHKDLASAEGVLINEIGRESKLKKAIAPALEAYDVILIDCTPSLGLLTVNALTASSGVIIPLECEFFALLGVQMVLEKIALVKEHTNPQISLVGILPTMFEKKTSHSREVLQVIHDKFADDLFDTIIPRTVRFSETTAVGQPITVYAPQSVGAYSYRRLAREIISRGGVK